MAAFLLLMVLLMINVVSILSNKEPSVLVLTDSEEMDEYQSALSLNSGSTECAAAAVNENYQKKIDQLERRLQQLEHMASVGGSSAGMRAVEATAAAAAKTLENLKNWVIESIPPSDEACTFDWKSLSCAPSCYCTMAAKLGDYSPSRACRRKEEHEIEPNCIGHRSEPSIVHRAVGHAKEVVVSQSSELLAKASAVVTAKVTANAPPTDEDCRWNWKKMHCSPAAFCGLDYQLGDYSLDRSCRLRTDFDEVS